MIKPIFENVCCCDRTVRCTDFNLDTFMGYFVLWFYATKNFLFYFILWKRKNLDMYVLVNIFIVSWYFSYSLWLYHFFLDSDVYFFCYFIFMHLWSKFYVKLELTVSQHNNTIVHYFTTIKFEFNTNIIYSILNDVTIYLTDENLKNSIY